MLGTNLMWIIAPWCLALLCDIKFRGSTWYLPGTVVLLACICMMLGVIYAPNIGCIGRPCRMIFLGNLVKAIGFNSLVFSLGMFCLYKWRR